MNDRIREAHLSRKAVLYVRQSTAFQVQQYEESRRLQYAMREQLLSAGWNEVEVIDDDMGVSAAGENRRAGFDRLVAEVCLGRVGVVAARELSRFARNSRDWQRLIEVCRVVDTLLLDHETVYDTRRGNDRLLLGLKGSLNEYELDVLRLRSLEARYEKARRGELVVAAPIGYIRRRDQTLEKTPDERVRQCVQLAFDKFFELGTARQVLAWFQMGELKFPRVRLGSDGHEVIWTRPRYSHFGNLFKNPVYAGTYVYGRHRTERRVVDGEIRKKSTRQPPEHWRSTIHGHHAGYVTLADFERIQKMLADNLVSSGHSSRGAAKRGVALLAGLLRCRRCGKRLTVTYTGREQEKLRYACFRGHLDAGENRCLSFGGMLPDAVVGEEVLRALEPAALEAARMASENMQARDDRELAARRLEAKEARYKAERARRHYEAVDPENRLVAAELERRWNDALRQATEAEARLEKETAMLSDKRGASLSREELEELSRNLSCVWHAESTDAVLRKRIARTLIEEIIVDRDEAGSELVFLIHWKGGVHTERRFPWRRRGFSSAHTPMETVEGVRWLAKITDDERIASWLGQNNLRTGYGREWTKTAVTSLRGHHHIPVFSAERKKAEGWLTLTEAAAIVGVASLTMKRAHERGEIPAQRPFPVGPYVFRRSDLTPEVMARLLNRSTHHKCGGRQHAAGNGTLFKITT